MELTSQTEPNEAVNIRNRVIICKIDQGRVEPVWAGLVSDERQR